MLKILISSNRLIIVEYNLLIRKFNLIKLIETLIYRNKILFKTIILMKINNNNGIKTAIMNNMLIIIIYKIPMTKMIKN